MAIYVEDETVKINFIDPKTNEESDAYFVIRRELPHKYQMDYFDLAMSYELDLDGEEDSEVLKVKAQANKLRVSQVTDILIEGGLVEISGVIEKSTDKPITAADWKKLPNALIGQISKAIQKTAQANKKTTPKN